MTHVRTVTRHTAGSGFVDITLKAMPTDPDARPWVPTAERQPDIRAVTIADECLQCLRAAGQPMRSTAIAKTIRRRQDSTAKALARLMAAGLVMRRREQPRGNAAYLWSLPDD